MSGTIRMFIALKFIFIAALLLVFYATRDAAAEDSKPASTLMAKANPSSAGKDDEDLVLPDVPKGKLTLEDAVQVREELEAIKSDVEDKIKKLQMAKKSYDRAKSDLTEKLNTVEEQNKFLDETLQKEKKVKAERLEEALAFVAKMDSKKAAPILEAMDRDLVLALFRKLPQKQVTKILESVSPKKATEFMEYYTRIRSGREFELMRELGACGPEPKESNAESQPNSGKAP